MECPTEATVLAIDGGGTHCRIAARRDGETVTVETGSANVSTDFEGSVQQIKKGLTALARKLGEAADSLAGAPTYLGVAGMTGEVISKKLKNALPLLNLRVADDRPAAVRGALGARDGFLAHCGTGSFYASQIDGGIRLSGGWGPVLGDEASAQWIGRRALSRALETLDGRVSPSPYSARLLDEYAGSAGIVRFAGIATPVDFGALAPMVTDFAKTGDALAAMVMREGAEEIVRAVESLGWASGRVLCLTGGIGSHYADYLPDALRDNLADPIGQPLDGALSLAEDFAQELANERR